MMERKKNNWIKNLLATLFWVAAWHILAISIENPLLLPTPVQVIRRLWELMATESFWRSASMSIGRILAGAVAALVLGVVLAVMTTASSLLQALVEPLMTAVQATPVASITILVLIWLDRDYVPVLICAMMVLPVVWNNVCVGIRTTDPKLLELAKVYRLSGFQTLRRIYIPSVMPYFRAACSSGLGLGWKAGIAAEVLTVPKASIGKMISESKLYLMTEDLFAWTLAVVLLSLALQKLMLKILTGRANHA